MFNKIMEQMQKAQTGLKDVKEEFAKIIVVGESGAGMVKVTMNGLGLVDNIDIDSSLYKEDNCEQIIPDLVKAAINNAREKIDREKSERTKSLLSKFGLPENFDFPS